MLRKYINDVKGNKIFKVFSSTAVSTIIKVLTGIVSVKVVSVIIGPAGIALLGQLKNFSSMVMIFSCGGINGGITKYISQYKDDENKLKIYLSVALKITVICSLFCSVLMLLLHKQLSNLIFLSAEYSYVFIIFSLTLLFYALNNFLMSVLNGYMLFRKYVVISIISSILGLIFTLSLVFALGLKGALISTVTFQSIMLIVTVLKVRQLPWFHRSFFKEKIKKEVLIKYLNYSLMAIVTAFTVPLTQLLLRGYVIANISLNEAGWWEAMNRISGMYLMVVTTSFGVYYLPRLSEINNKQELRKEIFSAYKLIIPVISVGFVFIYLLRNIIVKILFTDDFLPMENLFLWQLIGDFFKISSWLLAYLMVAKAKTKLFIATEILFSLLIISLSVWFINLNGIVGASQAYAFNYFIHFAFILFLYRELVFNSKKTIDIKNNE